MSSFTVRVYGICIENNFVLVTDEFVHSKYITKFPGGGLEFGEGTIDCLKREMIEETGQEIKVLKHLYTTDFFQLSAFDRTKQVISIYYIIRFMTPIKFQVKEKQFDFEKLFEGAQIFRWIALNTLRKEDISLPIDRIVAGMLKELTVDN